MITKERLKALIKEEKTIYCVDWGNYIEELELCAKDEIDIIGEVYNEPKECLFHYRGEYGGSDAYMFKNLFETKEEAEWYKEFGNIVRSELLDLPTWEEFDKKGYFEFVDKTGTALILEKTLVIDFDKKTISDYDLNILIKNDYNHTSLFRAECTKENYTLACRKCKELFLGEKDE